MTTNRKCRAAGGSCNCSNADAVSCPDQRATAPAMTTMPALLLNIGRQMANVMFNLAQKAGEPLEDRDCDVMRELYKQWDDVRRTTTPQAATTLPGGQDDLHTAASELLRYLDDHNWGGIIEGEVANRLRAALTQQAAPEAPTITLMEGAEQHSSAFDKACGKFYREHGRLPAPIEIFAIASPVAAPEVPTTWIADVIRDVAELPNRDSPADQPDMMLVSAEELREIIERHAAYAAAPEAPTIEQCNCAQGQCCPVCDPDVYASAATKVSTGAAPKAPR